MFGNNPGVRDNVAENEFVQNRSSSEGKLRMSREARQFKESPRLKAIFAEMARLIHGKSCIARLDRSLGMQSFGFLADLDGSPQPAKTVGDESGLRLRKIGQFGGLL
jgi:hypothetical protein